MQKSFGIAFLTSVLSLLIAGIGLNRSLAQEDKITAQELIEAWVKEKRSRGESIPVETKSLVTQVEIPDAVLRP